MHHAARARAGRPRSPRSRPGAGERLCGGEIPISDERTSVCTTPRHISRREIPPDCGGDRVGLVTPLASQRCALRPPPRALNTAALARTSESSGGWLGGWLAAVANEECPRAFYLPVGCLETRSPRQMLEKHSSIQGPLPLPRPSSAQHTLLPCLPPTTLRHLPQTHTHLSPSLLTVRADGYRAQFYRLDARAASHLSSEATMQ